MFQTFQLIVAAVGTEQGSVLVRVKTGGRRLVVCVRVSVSGLTRLKSL